MNSNQLFEKQIQFQRKILVIDENTALPTDNLDGFAYHCLAMMEEMGEVLKADKRWKTHRNKRYEVEEKLDEFADVYITLMNMCIYSNITMEDLLNAVDKKINQNFDRLKND